MITEYVDWIMKNGIPPDPYTGGFSMLGATYRELQAGKPLKPQREEAIAQFAFAIPSMEALQAIASLGPLLEVGSGTGYWAYELRKLGVDIIATDPKVYSDNNVKPQKLWTDMLVMDANRALMEHGADRTLMFCWPSYNVKWPVNALKQYTGNKLVYVGEWRACTADNEFHDVLEADWHESLDIAIPFWSGIHDRVFIFERKCHEH